MSLRDYFAAKALVATLARLPLTVLTDTHNLTPELPRMTAEEGAVCKKAAAKLAYEYADAMLAARQPQEAK